MPSLAVLLVTVVIVIVFGKYWGPWPCWQLHAFSSCPKPYASCRPRVVTVGLIHCQTRRHAMQPDLAVVMVQFIVRVACASICVSEWRCSGAKHLKRLSCFLLWG